MAEPMTKARITGVMPMKRLRRAPTMRRLSRSRPSSSVPSGWPSVPMGLRRDSMLLACGSAGAIQGPNTAMASSASTTDAATQNTGSRITRTPTLAQ